MNYEEYYKTFLDAWGYEAQSTMCIEEMGELIKALCKYKRHGYEESTKEIKDNILEEIADVLNVVEQMSFYFGKDKIKEIREQKLKRALSKIKK